MWSLAYDQCPILIVHPTDNVRISLQASTAQTTINCMGCQLHGVITAWGVILFSKYN